MGDGQDTEITLGTGKLLSIFFGLVALCAIFFGFGYMMGRGTSAQTAASTASASTPLPTADASKPNAGKGSATNAADCPPGQNCAPTDGSELSFYRAVEQQTPDTQSPVAQPSQTVPQQVSTTPPQQSAAPETNRASLATVVPNGTGYIVQVAAVSKQQDADALASALRRKNYTAVVNNPGDRLYHVQIGPFLDFKDADAMRARLQADGYSPIVKR